MKIINTEEKRDEHFRKRAVFQAANTTQKKNLMVEKKSKNKNNDKK